MADRHPSPVLRHLRHLTAPHESQVPDAELLERFVTRRDPEAFAALVERHGPLVLRVCRRALPDAHDAEDAFQATFLVLARKAGSIARRELLANWLHGVAARVAARARVEAARRLNREAQAEARPVSDPLAEVTARELCAVLDEELSRLPACYRAPLLLCYLEGQTRDQVARQLGWSVRTLTRRLERGREALRRRLTRRGLALPAALLVAGLSQQGASAGVPTRLVAATAKVGLTAAAPPGPAALAEGALRAMSCARRKGTAAVLAALLLAGAGAGALVYRPAPAGPRPEQGPRPAAAGPRAEGRPAATDRYGDPLPAGALTRLGTTRFRHQHTVRGVAYSRDGTLLATGSWDGTLRVWEAATGRELRRFPAPGASCVAVSPDGKLVAGGGMDKALAVWDVATGAEVFRAAGLENTVLSGCFSPDGKSLAAVSGSALRIWDVRTKREALRIDAPAGLRPLAYMPDGKALAAGCEDHTGRLWDAATGRELRRFEGHTDMIYSLAVSPDGKMLATGAGDKDRTVILWDVASGKELRRLSGPPGWVRPVTFAPDGQTLACGGQDRTVRLYDVATGREARRCVLPGPPDTWVMGVAFAPDGRRLASVGTEKAVRLWDVAAGKEVRPFEGHQNEITHVAVCPDGRAAVTAGQDGLLCLWDLAAGRVVRQWSQDAGVNGLALSADGRRLATTDGPVVRLRALPSGEEVRVFPSHHGRVDAVALSPDGSALAAAGWPDHTLRLWDVASGRERWQVRFPAPRGANYGDCPLAFTPDGKVLISGSADRTNKVVYFWDAATGKELRRLEQSASHLALSPDGRLLATGGWDRIVRLWDVATGQELRRLDTPAGALAFAPDGRALATGDVSGTVRLWELATGAERARLRGHQSGGNEKSTFAAGVSALAFFPDGRRLLSGGGDTTALVWDLYRAPGERRPPEALWADLAKPDAAPAYDALRGLLAAPGEATAFLKDRLAPAAAPDAQKVARLVAALDSASFEAREEATRELERLGEAALPALRRARSEGPSAEARRRAAGLVGKLDGLTPPGEALRAVRAVEVLERVGSAEAWRLLAQLAKGAPEARLTREAKAALGRRPRE